MIFNLLTISLLAFVFSAIGYLVGHKVCHKVNFSRLENAMITNERLIKMFKNTVKKVRK